MSTTAEPTFSFHEIKFLRRLRDKYNGEVELKPFAVIPEESRRMLEKLVHKGFIRLSDAFVMPFKAPTGTKFAIMTEAGTLALKGLDKKRELHT